MSDKTAHTTPVLDKAVNQIRDLVRAESLRPGDVIPSVRVLARRMGVSYVTMCSALRSLAESGVLIAANNRRYRVAGPGAEKAFAVPARLRDADRGIEPWKRAASRIEADILNGAFKPGSRLPTLKELQGRYGVSYPTVVKALDSLTTRQAIQRQTNGSYRVPGFTAGSWKSTIVCFITSPDQGATLAFGQHDEAVFRALESQCELAGVKIDIQLVVYEKERDLHRFKHRTTGVIRDAGDVRKTDNESILGYAYLIPWFPRDTDRTAINELSLLKKPVVVMDETSLLNLPEETIRRPWVRVISAAVSPDPAKIVAQHLLSLGHRKVAFLSTERDRLWSRLRLEGVQAAFAEAGFAGGVVPLIAQALVNVYEYETWLISSGQQERSLRCDFTLLDATYDQWRKGLTEPYRTEVDAIMERLHVDGSQRGEVRTVLQPLLDRALADPGITAWVTANDYTATLALTFLKAKGVRVPADLSLISFDDSTQAVRNNFSSYNFNPTALASYILGTIVGRDPFSGHDARVSGFVVNRGSTGPAKLRTT